MKVNSVLAALLLALIGSVAHGQPLDQAKGWAAMAIREQQAYIIGFSEGSFWTWFEVSLACPASSDRVKRMVLDSAFGSQAIASVVSDLYRDPANKFIPPNDLVLIAAKKLKGERIEEDLLLARTKAYNYAKQP